LSNLKNRSLCGWIGSVLLALCAVPEVIKTISLGDCQIGWGMLLMWYFGEIFILIPVVRDIKSPFLIFNYVANIILISIMIYYKMINIGVV